MLESAEQTDVRPLEAEATGPRERVQWNDLITPTLLPRTALVCLGIWLNAADSLVTATIMPSVGRDLGGYAFFGWAVAGYLMGSILAGASAGQLSQRFGLKSATLLAALIYAVGCVVSAVAPGISLFLAGRLLQGVGAGWIVGFCYIAVGVVFPERLWARMFAATAGVWGVATLLGPLVGGIFAAAGHWRWAFWMFGLQGLIFAAAAGPLLGANPHAGEARPLAWRTLGTLGLGVIAIGVADVAPGWKWPAGLVVTGLAMIVCAVQINSRPTERLLPRNAARPFSTAGAGYAMMFAMTAAAAVFSVYGAALLQSLYGVSPLTAGYVIGAEALGWTGMAFLVSGQPNRRHSAFILFGAGAIVAGLVVLAFVIDSRVLGLVIAGGALLGSGFGLSWSLATRRILASLPDEERSIASSAVPTTQLVGGAVGAALAGAIANFSGLAHDFSPGQVAVSAPWLFGSFVPIAVVGWIAALGLAREPVRLS